MSIGNALALSSRPMYSQISLNWSDTQSELLSRVISLVSLIFLGLAIGVIARKFKLRYHMAQTKMNDLPPEIIAKIIGYSKEFDQTGQVSKKWAAITDLFCVQRLLDIAKEAFTPDNLTILSDLATEFYTRNKDKFKDSLDKEVIRFIYLHLIYLVFEIEDEFQLKTPAETCFRLRAKEKEIIDRLLTAKDPKQNVKLDIHRLKKIIIHQLLKFERGPAFLRNLKSMDLSEPQFIKAVITVPDKDKGKLVESIILSAKNDGYDAVFLFKIIGVLVFVAYYLEYTVNLLGKKSDVDLSSLSTKVSSFVILIPLILRICKGREFETIFAIICENYTKFYFYLKGTPWSVLNEID